MKFCTVFPNFESIHKNKDVGLIPKLLSDKYKLDSFIICRTLKKDQESKVKDANLTFLTIYAKTLFFFYFKVLLFILKNNIKIINLYHFKKETYICAIIFRIFLKKIYIKLDIDNIQFEFLIKTLESKGPKAKFILIFIKCVYMFSVETQELFFKLNEYSYFKGKMFLLRNGPSKDSIPVKPINIINRKNNILVVARLGVKQKNHEMLFEWLDKLDEQFKWSISFAGKTSNNFESLFSNFKRKHPYIQATYLGELNRDELFKQYAESKLFLMTSKWEAQSVAMAEAAIMGLYIVTTQVSGSQDVTNSGKYGLIINGDNISAEMEKLLKGSRLENEYDERLNYARENFLLDNSIVIIANKLQIKLK